VDAEPTDRIQVLFRPCGLSRFTILPVAAVSGRIVPADTVFSADPLNELAQKLSSSCRFEERVAELDRFFMSLYTPPDRLEEEIHKVAVRLLQRSGSLPWSASETDSGKPSPHRAPLCTSCWCEP
jgi:hypothetical protein